MNDLVIILFIESGNFSISLIAFMNVKNFLEASFQKNLLF